MAWKHTGKRASLTSLQHDFKRLYSNLALQAGRWQDIGNGFRWVAGLRDRLSQRGGFPVRAASPVTPPNFFLKGTKHMNRKVWHTAVLSGCLALTASLYGQQGPKNLKVLPADTSQQKIMGMMMGMSKALGVNCDHCHVQAAFDKDEKPEKEVARSMMRMMANLREHAEEFVPDGRIEKVTCWTCHRGSAKIELPSAGPAGGGPGSPPAGDKKP
jgi:hypothetical protein